MTNTYTIKYALPDNSIHFVMVQASSESKAISIFKSKRAKDWLGVQNTSILSINL